MDNNEFLQTLLGKLLSENCQLTDEEFKELKERVSKQYDKECPIELEEFRKRVQENFYGTVVNLLVNILSLAGDSNDLIRAICKKLEIEVEE